MSGREKRKAAIAAYKERKRAVGVFALRCEATGEAWVGGTQNLDTIRNRCWFTLRTGAHPIRSLQDAWMAHGEQSFRFEILEQIEDETQYVFLDDVLKERAAHWRSKLNAAPI